MDPAISPLIDRAGLDRGKVRQLIGRGLDGADDGELLLEYRQSEVLVFDNGRLHHAAADDRAGRDRAQPRARSDRRGVG